MSQNYIDDKILTFDVLKHVGYHDALCSISFIKLNNPDLQRFSLGIESFETAVQPFPT